MVKPIPVTVAAFTVISELPVDVSVTDLVAAEFTAKSPKFRLAAPTINCGLGAAAPVPLRATAAVLPLDELLLIIICPLAVPVAIGLNCICSVSDWFGFKVAGKLPPPRKNPAPLIVAEFTVTEAIPVDVSVSVCVVDVFTVTLPKLKFPTLNVSCGLGAAVLAPLSATIAVLPVEELLLIANWPFATPVIVGLNCICSISDWFGFNVAGKFPLTNENPIPLIVAELIVTGAVPVDVNVSACVVDVFTVTLPKLKLPTLNVNCGSCVTALLPLSNTVAVLFVAESLLIVNWPLVAPVAVGLNFTCSVSDWFGFNVAGKLPPTNENPLPLIITELIVTGDVPADVRVNACIVDEPTVTLSKSSLLVLTDICAVNCVKFLPRP
jgi:hypothetical protein